MNYFAPKFISADTTKYDYGPYTLVTLSDPDPVEYVQDERTSHMIRFKQVANNQIMATFSQSEWHGYVEAGKVHPVPDFFKPERQEALILHPDIKSYSDVPEDQREQVEFYRRLIQRVEVMRENKEASLSDKSLRAAIPKAWSELTVALRMSGVAGDVKARKTFQHFDIPSPGTFRRWRRKLAAWTDNPLAIRDRRRARSGNRAPRIKDPLVLAILNDHVRKYLDTSRPTVAGLHKEMRGVFKTRNDERVAKGLPKLPVPSLSTLERAVRKLDKFQVVLAREGEEAARKRCKIAGRRQLAVRPGERVSIDNWRTHIKALKLPSSFWEGVDEKLRDKLGRIRVNLCIAIDEATKIVLGARISINADAATSLKTLEMVCRDKTDIAIASGCASAWNHRVWPRIIPTDNGSEFANNVMLGAIRDLSAQAELGIAGEPNGRPVVERFFRTIDAKFLQFFTGRTFSNPGEQGEYNSDKMASVLVEDLSALFVRWIVDVYHNEPHAGLGMETPNDAWERCCAMHGAMSAPDVDQMRAIFGFTDTRIIVDRGIRFMGLDYYSEELGKMRASVGAAEVLIRADMADIGWISVRRNVPGAGWISVPCEYEEFEGVSAAQWMDVTEGIRRKHANAAALREEIVLNAIADLRAAGQEAAEKASIGPTILTDRYYKEQERKLYDHFNIVIAPKPGKSLEGMLPSDPDGLVAPAVDIRSDAGAVRRGIGANFLED